MAIRYHEQNYSGQDFLAIIQDFPANAVRISWDDPDYMNRITFTKKVMKIIGRDLGIVAKFTENSHYFIAYFKDPSDQSRRAITRINIGIELTNIQLEHYC